MSDNKKIKPALSKGTRDFLPEEIAKRNFLFDVIKKVFAKYGFQQIETPAIERLETLTGKYGEEGDKLLFKILNSGDFLKDTPDAILAEKNSRETLKHIAEKGLRYDLTVPLARYVVQHQEHLAFPFRRFHIGPVWRADRPQKGRYQEFYQCDADVIGSESLYNEIELVSIFSEVFHMLQFDNVELKISNRKILAGLAEVMKAEDKFTALTIAIDKLDKVEKEKVLSDLQADSFNEQQIKLLDEYLGISGGNDEKLAQLKTYFSGNETALAGIKELEFVINTSHIAHFASHISIDQTLARGLNYYTGFIIEVKNHSGSLRSSIGSGGRYDNLTEMFGGRNMPGVGISFGIERIYDIMEELNLFPNNVSQGTKVLLAYFDEPSQQYAFNVLQQLRAAGVAAEMYPSVSKLAKQLDYANKKKIANAIIIGSEEMQSGLLALKNLIDGTQQKLSVADILKVMHT
jgi:histidyl-tRNA synthetase